MNELEARIVVNDARARIMRKAAANTRTATEEMLEGIGTKLTTIWLLVDGRFIDEKHVDDPITIQVTAKMSAERLKARAWMLEIAGEWEVTRYRDLTFRRYPTREAAEMAAIHLAR